MDLAALREAYSALSDRMATALFGQGLDFDDVVIERMLFVQSDDRSLELSADFLSDASALQQSIERQCRASGTLTPGLEARIRELRIRAVVEQ
jgi:hypothetical protein